MQNVPARFEIWLTFETVDLGKESNIPSPVERSLYFVNRPDVIGPLLTLGFGVECRVKAPFRRGQSCAR